MSIITQYILQKGISEDIFILVFSIPIILAVIIFARRIIGLRTFGLYTPLALVALLTIIGIKKGAFLFVSVFGLMVIIRYFLKKIRLLSMTDTRVLDSLVFCCLVFILLLMFIFVPRIKEASFDFITLLTIFIISYYSEGLITTWEIRGLKRFISAGFESLLVIIGSYFLISWTFIEKAVLKHPIELLFIAIIIILLLARWRGLKIKEYLEFRSVIKNVELPPKK